MNKQTTYTFNAYNASVYFCTHDAEIAINDHACGEFVSIEGLNQRDLHDAMINYVHNAGLRKDKETFLDFLVRMQDQVARTLAVYEASES